MARIIEAKAVISATDNTGNVFDRIAQKIKGVEKAAKGFGNLPKFMSDSLGKGSAFGFEKEIQRLASSAKEFEAIRKSIERSYASFGSALFKNGPMSANKALGALDMWKNRTLANLRAVQAGYDGVAESHKKFFSHAGRFALHAAGIGGAAYATGHAIRSVAKSASARQRETVRYEQMGLTADEQAQANSTADTISSRYPSLSRTEVLKYLRTNAARLGSFDRSIQAADPYARALISNKLSGGDEHEMEQIVRALEGMGKANTAEQLTSGLNAFSKAKAANPDYKGSDFANDMRTAAASKYAMSKDYLENVFPILASHTSGFGNKLSTGLSALVGGRMTKKSKARLQEAGLLDSSGNLLDEKGYIANNFEWTQKHVRPLLERRGVKFGEDMSEDDKSKVTSFASKHFSAKNAADLIITNLLDQPLVERARRRKTVGLEGMDSLQRQDSGLAAEGVKNQLSDLSTAILNLKPIIAGMNIFADKLSGATNTFNSGTTADKTGMLIGSGLAGAVGIGGGVAAARGLYQWFTGAGQLSGAAVALDASAAALTRAAVMLAGGKSLAEVAGGGAAAAAAGGSVFGLGAAALPFIAGGGALSYLAARSFASNPNATSAYDDNSVLSTLDPDGAMAAAILNGSRKGEATRRALRQYAAPGLTDTMTYGTGVGGDKQITAQLTGSAEVHGEVTNKIIVEASSTLLQIVQQAQSAIKLVGQVNANGPGSTGISSPDAAAPGRGAPLNTGAATGDY